MGNKEPLISVIVPVYNGQNCLADCIDSIEKQTYENLEIIVVNDGSTDQTMAVCESLQVSYNNIKILTLNDEGVSAARNAGIEASEGDFVTFVDADDRLRPEMLRILYNSMVRSGSDVTGCRFFLWSRESEWEREIVTDAVVGETKIYDTTQYLGEAVLQGNNRCWSKLYRRAVVEQVHFQKGLSIGEDMLFLIKMLSVVDRIAEIDYPGYGYYRNPTGAINREFTPGYMDQITCWQLAREEIMRIEPDLEPQVMALCMIGIMLTAGKFAMLPAKKRRDYQEYVRICRERLREAMKVPGAYGKLSAGYRLKVILFRVFPNLYLLMYHLHKTRRFF